MGALGKGMMAALAITALFTAGTAFGEQQPAGEHKFEKAAAYYAQCSGASSADFDAIRERVKAFTDVEIMAQTMADPERFMQLAETVNDPRTMHVMMNCATEPVMWDTWMKGAADYPKMMRAATTMMNPATMMSWMMAPMNPKVWSAAMGHMNAEKYVRWSQAPANPEFYKPMTSMTDENWYKPRLAWMSNSASFEPIFKMFTGFASAAAPAPASAPATPAPAAPAK